MWDGVDINDHPDPIGEYVVPPCCGSLDPAGSGRYVGEIDEVNCVKHEYLAVCSEPSPGLVPARVNNRGSVHVSSDMNVSLYSPYTEFTDPEAAYRGLGPEGAWRKGHEGEGSVQPGVVKSVYAPPPTGESRNEYKPVDD